MITGGSQGAHALNMAVLAGLPRLTDMKDRLAFLHITGEGRPGGGGRRVPGTRLYQ